MGKPDAVAAGPPLSPAPTDSSARLTMAVMFCALAAEIAIFALAAGGPFGMPAFAAAHLAVTAAVALLLWRPLRSGADGGVALLGVLATFATGPFGAAGTLVLPALAATNRLSEARLAGWYQRIALSAEQDDFTRTSDAIAIGRAANLAAPTPNELAHTFRGGATAGQQTALGMIARNFHPAYLPVLKIALESPEPVIRVQAAAVAARVRETMKREIGPMLARAADPQLAPDDALALAADLDMSAASGLLEDASRSSAVRAGAGLKARTFARLDAEAGRTRSGTPRLTTAPVAEAYLAHLLETGRIADFRAARTRVRLPVIGRYRRRCVVLSQRPRAPVRFRTGTAVRPRGLA